MKRKNLIHIIIIYFFYSLQYNILSYILNNDFISINKCKYLKTFLI